MGKQGTEFDVNDPPAPERNTGRSRSKNNLQYDVIQLSQLQALSLPEFLAISLFIFQFLQKMRQNSSTNNITCDSVLNHSQRPFCGYSSGQDRKATS